jgi:hypothetical protein
MVMSIFSAKYTYNAIRRLQPRCIHRLHRILFRLILQDFLCLAFLQQAKITENFEYHPTLTNTLKNVIGPQVQQPVSLATGNIVIKQNIIIIKSNIPASSQKTKHSSINDFALFSYLI